MPVIVGGYPYGTEMFLYTQSNRDIVQPTFHAGMISAVIPTTASNKNEHQERECYTSDQ
jgi:hypothetical protein